MSQPDSAESSPAEVTCTKIAKDIIIVLDESGSMDIMGNEPKEAINEFVAEQQTSLGDDGSTFSLWTFNTSVTKLIDDENLQEIKEFTCYTPGGMTALNDAIGLAITTKKIKAQNKNVICMIISDGCENASQNYSSLRVKNMIKEMETEHNWKFIYLGANQDAYVAGNSMGLNHKRCSNFEQVPGGLRGVTRTASQNIASYRSATAEDNNPDIDLDISGGVSKRTQSCPDFLPDSSLPPPNLPLRRHYSVQHSSPLVPPPLVRHNNA